MQNSSPSDLQRLVEDAVILSSFLFAIVGNVLLQANLNDITALVVAVGVLLGTVGGIVTMLVPYIRRLSKEAGDKAAIVGESLKETDRWILENQQKLTTAISVVANLSPTAKAELEKQGLNIVAMTEELVTINDELDRLHAILPERTVTK